MMSSRRSPDARRALLVSRTWVQAAALVVLCGVAVLGFLAYRAYTTDPPIADRVVNPDGQVLFTGEDVTKGQQIFLRKGLMEYGSILGHGAYLGADFTADYLHRAAEIVVREYGGSGSDTARQRVIRDFKTNRYDAASGTLTYTAAQAVAYEELVGHYRDYFGATSGEKGLRPDAITDDTEIRRLTSFFSWTAWAGSTLRPGKNYSYTNSWPPEPLVGNEPTANVVVWSVLSLIALLVGIGVLTSQIAQTTLRSVLGRADLDALLAERDQLNDSLRRIIDEQTEPWGIKVTTVEIKDVEIPEAMQRAMARQAEAERERRAKIINAEGEFQAAEKVYEAAEILSRNPAALQLRYLQTLLEIGGERSTVVFPLPMELIKPFLGAAHQPGGAPDSQ